MKDNTMLYLGIGFAVVYLLTKKGAAAVPVTAAMQTTAQKTAATATNQNPVIPVVALSNAIATIFKSRGNSTPRDNTPLVVSDNSAMQELQSDTSQLNLPTTLSIPDLMAQSEV